MQDLTLVSNSTPPAKKNSQSTQFGLEEYCSRHVYHPPDVLRSLRAWEALGYPNRAREQRPPFTVSHAKNTLQLLKYAMLIVEASLPIGAVDTSEDRWSDNFAESWREGMSPSPPSHLITMER
jgi:hypothetical protein